MAVQVWDTRKSECFSVMEKIGALCSTAKAGPRLVGLSLQDNLENRNYEEKQMTSMIQSSTGAFSASELTWDTINWPHVTKEVKRLQMRIAKAAREKRYGKVKALQWLLTHSFSAKLLAVKRVTQNSGAKTPGIDGVLWRTSNQKMQVVNSLQRRGYQPQPLLRIYIPKKQGRRPLSIPTLKDRSMQALHLLSLEPVSEMVADRNAYGFRPKRSAADAIHQCYIALARKASPTWILEGDIRACFDTLSGTWLQKHIPMDKQLLTKWLTAGYMEKNSLHSTFDGVPQGGLISPTLLVLALSGLEKAIKASTSPKDKVNVVIYADDFIVTATSKEVLETKVMPVVASFLKERGLELSLKKTKITHIEEGFNFLGFNVRKYKGKYLSKPSKESIKRFLDDIRKTIKSNRTVKTESLIRLLNPKIRGWTNYYCHVVSKEAFTYVDSCIFLALMKWIKRRHPKKGAKWRCKKYFRSQGLQRWIFCAEVKDKKGNKTFLDLFKAVHVPIRRHVKVKADATPYDPEFKEYFLNRRRIRKGLLTRNQMALQLKPITSRDDTLASGSH
jgi:RNA-directed DNA polymerase